MTAVVLAYQEVTGGALTTALTPGDIVMVARYMEAGEHRLSAPSPDQVEAIVSAFQEAGLRQIHAASGLHGLYRKIRRH